jgi:uncharacterized membrane protein
VNPGARRVVRRPRMGRPVTWRPMTWRPVTWRPVTWPSVTLAVSGWVALAATWLPAGSGVRSVAVAIFLLSCPGTALVRRFWPGKDRLERAVLAVALSIAVSVLVTEAQTFAGLWQPRWSIAILALLTTVLATVAVQPPAQLSTAKEKPAQ